MTHLEIAYYIIGIVFMSLMLLIGLLALISLLVIRSKINAIHHNIEDRLSHLADWAERGNSLIKSFKGSSSKTK